MPSSFIETINEKNLCTWYILPLIDLNKFNFSEANLINSYLTRDGKSIAVEVADWNLCPAVTHNQCYQRRISLQYSDLLVFDIGSEWRSDVKLFMQGAYSKMSDEAKEVIRLYSGLKYKVVDEQGRTRTDSILLALDRHPVLRSKWLLELSIDTGVKRPELEIPDDLELLSIPSDKCYIDLKQQPSI